MVKTYIKMTERQTFVSVRSAYFQTMIIESNLSILPLSIARQYWKATTSLTYRYMELGTWREPLYMKI